MSSHGSGNLESAGSTGTQTKKSSGITFEEFKAWMLIDGWSYSRYSYTRYGELKSSLITTTRWEKGTQRLWWTPDDRNRYVFQYITDDGEVKKAYTFETMLKILEEW